MIVEQDACDYYSKSARVEYMHSFTMSYTYA